MNVQTLRYYERRGLLPGADRRESGYREFGDETVRLVRFIKHAQQLGFTLREVEELIQLRDNRSQNAAAVCTIASAKASDIASRIRRLSAIRRVLEELVSTCRSGGPGRDCPILEALDDDQPAVCCEATQPITNGDSDVDE